MLGKRSRPKIGNFSGAGVVDPRDPLECKMYPNPTPRGLKNYDQGGVGLGIVVALDKSKNVSSPGEVLAKYTRSSPIPVNPSPAKSKHGIMCSGNNSVDMMEGLDEDVTYVTSHGPNNSVTTRVYYDGGHYNQRASVFMISPMKEFNDHSNSNSDSDFLSSCRLCKKSLHGKDIYMYRGEAFCSEECRESRIGKDEKKEKCRLEAIRSNDVVSSSSSSSPPSPPTYNFRSSRGQIFSPGIVAA